MMTVKMVTRDIVNMNMSEAVMIWVCRFYIQADLKIRFYRNFDRLHPS